MYTGQSLQCGDAIVMLTKHYVHRQLNMTIVYFRRDFYLPFCGGGVTFPNLCEAVCAAAASSSTWILLKNLLLNRRNVRIIDIEHYHKIHCGDNTYKNLVKGQLSKKFGW